MEAYSRHSPSVKLLLKLLRQSKLLRTELVVAKEHSDLHRHLDEVLHHLLGLRTVAGVFLRHPVELIQDLAASVVNEHIHHRLAGHVAEDFLLGLHGHVFGTEGLHRGFWKTVRKQMLISNIIKKKSVLALTIQEIVEALSTSIFYNNTNTCK